MLIAAYRYVIMGHVPIKTGAEWLTSFGKPDNRAAKLYLFVMAIVKLFHQDPYIYLAYYAL